MAAMPRDASRDEVLGAGQACFRMNVEECHRCHRRPGVFFGLRGFGWRHRGHEPECIRRSANIAAPPASGRPSAASAAPSQFTYASAASGRPSEAPSAAPSDWQTVGRPSEAPSAAPSDWQTCREQATPRESAVSQYTEPRGSTATQVPRDSAATQFNEPRPIDPRDSAATQFNAPRVSDTTQAVEEARGSTATQANLARCSVTTQVPADMAAFQQTKPCLHYFAFAGRGELARLIAAVGALDLDESVSTETEDSSSFGSPGALPCLTHGELRISQSFAIESYLAVIAPAYAHLTPAQRAIDSMFCKIKEDVLRSFAEVVMGQTSPSAEIITGIADKWFSVLEQELPHGGFVHGLVLPTAADLAALNIAKAFIPFGVAYDKAQYDPLAKWPKFAAHVGRVAQYPAVETYLQNSTSMQADPFGMRSQASAAKNIQEIEEHSSEKLQVPEAAATAEAEVADGLPAPCPSEDDLDGFISASLEGVHEALRMDTLTISELGDSPTKDPSKCISCDGSGCPFCEGKAKPAGGSAILQDKELPPLPGQKSERPSAASSASSRPSAAEPVAEPEPSGPVEEIEAPPLSEAVRGEAKLIFELCDVEGAKNITLRSFAAMCVKHRYVADVVGMGGASEDEVFEKIVRMVGQDKQDAVAWEVFEKLIEQLTVGVGRRSRLSNEQQIDLIFDSCEVLKNGEISLAEFSALCIKRPIIAEAVGMKRKESADGKRRKRIGQDDLFAQIDTDRSGQVTRQELRAFVWKQRANAVDAEIEQAGAPHDELAAACFQESAPVIQEAAPVEAPASSPVNTEESSPADVASKASEASKADDVAKAPEVAKAEEVANGGGRGRAKKRGGKKK